MDEHDYYGIPIWMMKDYLAQLGARERAENVMQGAGWQAVLRKADLKHIGSLTIGGTSVSFSGDEDALRAMFDQLHWKTLRAGG